MCFLGRKRENRYLVAVKGEASNSSFTFPGPRGVQGSFFPLVDSKRPGPQESKVSHQQLHGREGPRQIQVAETTPGGLSYWNKTAWFQPMQESLCEAHPPVKLSKGQRDRIVGRAFALHLANLGSIPVSYISLPVIPEPEVSPITAAYDSNNNKQL